METDEIIQKISEESGLTENEIRNKISEKEEELSGLISDEGAAHLVAKELGVNLLNKIKTRLEIKNVVEGMRNVDVTGKITNIFPVKNFKTEKAEGKVGNMIIADETGSIKLTLWNDETDVLDKIDTGDVIRVQGYVKNNNGDLEIRLGRYGKISKSDENIDVKVTEQKSSSSYERKDIQNTQKGSRIETRACIAQVFETKGTFEVCPECSKRLEKKDDKYVCKEHGEKEPDYLLVISGVIDDGTGNIRFSAFRENAEKLVGSDTKELKDKEPKEITKKVELGKEYVFRGLVKHNDFFDRPEFLINEIKEVDPKKEIQYILNR